VFPWEGGTKIRGSEDASENRQIYLVQRRHSQRTIVMQAAMSLRMYLWPSLRLSYSPNDPPRLSVTELTASYPIAARPRARCHIIIKSLLIPHYTSLQLPLTGRRLMEPPSPQPALGARCGAYELYDVSISYVGCCWYRDAW